MCIVEIDNGYWQTKTLEHTFRSKVQTVHDTANSDLNISNGKTYKVSLAGLEYLVGDGAESYNIELDKTNNDLHKITTYTMIGLHMKERYGDFNLLATYPLNLYSRENKEMFSRFLETNDYVPIGINGVEKYLYIKKCVVFPQTIPAMYINPSRYKDKIIAMLDIGGYTAQGCIVENFNMVTSSIFSEPLGCFVLFNNVKKRLNREFNINLQDYEIPHVIRKGLVSHPVKSLSIINDVVHHHCLEIKKSLRINNWNIENLEFVFIGGGSLLLRPQLKSMFKGELSDDPIMDGVKGLKIVAEMVKW